MEALREAERRFQVDKSVENEARLLVERVRVGALSEERLRLLAYARYPAAVVARGDEVKSPADDREWFTGLLEFERDAQIQAALVLLRLYACRDGGRSHTFGDVIISAEPVEWFSLTMPHLASHRGRIIRDGTRPEVETPYSLYTTSVRSCRTPRNEEPCICIESAMHVNALPRIFDEWRSNLGEIASDAAKQAKYTLTLWAFTSE